MQVALLIFLANNYCIEDKPKEGLVFDGVAFCEYRKDDDCSQHYQISQDYNTL